jgi:hypothetical protein
MDGEMIDEGTADLIIKELKKYETILFDFSYLKQQDAYDAKI